MEKAQVSKLLKWCKKIINVVDDFTLLQDPGLQMCGIHSLEFLERVANHKTFELCNNSYELNVFDVVLPYIKMYFVCSLLYNMRM